MTTIRDVEIAIEDASQAFNASLDGSITVPDAQQILRDSWFVLFSVALNIVMIASTLISTCVRRRKRNYSGRIQILNSSIGIISLALSFMIPSLFAHTLSRIRSEVVDRTDQVIFKDMIDKLDGNKISIEVKTVKNLTDTDFEDCDGVTCKLEVDFGAGDDVIDGSSTDFTSSMNDYVDAIKDQEPWVIAASIALPIMCGFLASPTLNVCCSPANAATTKTLTFLWFPMLFGTILFLALYPTQALIDEVRALPGGPTPLTASTLHLPFDEAIMAMNLTRSFINEKINEVDEKTELNCLSAYVEEDFFQSDCGKLSEDGLFNALCRSSIESATYLTLSTQSPCEDGAMTLSWSVLFAAEKLLSSEWFFEVQSNVLHVLKFARSMLLLSASFMYALVIVCSTLMFFSAVHDENAKKQENTDAQNAGRRRIML